jgi:hypothetical protein
VPNLLFFTVRATELYLPDRETGSRIQYQGEILLGDEVVWQAPLESNKDTAEADCEEHLYAMVRRMLSAPES